MDTSDLNRPSRRVVVALSGGVDSSAAAGLLMEAGYDVIGVTLRLHPCEQSKASRSCCGMDGVARARSVAGHLGIPHYVLDSSKHFSDHVLRPSWDDYAAGRTPSPCLLCNERIKFGVLLEWAREMGASFLATGHYARIVHDHDRPRLLRGVDPAKDQAYFLAGLTQEQLRFTLFPLGGWNKSEIREYALRMKLPTAETPDSQDACLVARGRSFAELLRLKFDAPVIPGPILDRTGQVVGHHQGLHHFTLGQRKGIPTRSTNRLWVTAVRRRDAAIVISEQETDLWEHRFKVVGMNWIDSDDPMQRRPCQVQVRHRQPAVEAVVEMSGPHTAIVTLASPMRAITPGQAAVFYHGEQVLGRGWIHDEEG